jgi:rubrerythrin
MTALEYALKMERDGEKYYSEQAEKNKGNKLQVVFALLAEEERKHADILEKHAGQSEYSLENSPALRGIPNVFENIEHGSRTDLKMFILQVDLYRLALDMENRSVALYEKLLSETDDDGEKALFGFLLGQEKEHVSLMYDFVAMLDRSRKTVFAESGLTDDY